jgi:hypothetical protein
MALRAAGYFVRLAPKGSAYYFRPPFKSLEFLQSTNEIIFRLNTSFQHGAQLTCILVDPAALPHPSVATTWYLYDPNFIPSLAHALK